MDIVDLFVIRNTGTTGVFTLPQSLASYPLAVCVVASVTRAARTILRVESDSAFVPLTVALTIGAAFVTIVAIHPRSRPRSWRGWLLAIGTAFLNSLVLFAAALGIEKF